MHGSRKQKNIINAGEPERKLKFHLTWRVQPRSIRWALSKSWPP